MAITKVFLDFQVQGTLADSNLTTEAQNTIDAMAIANEIVDTDVSVTSPNTTAILGAGVLPSGVVADVTGSSEGVLLDPSRIGVGSLSTPVADTTISLDRKELCELRNASTGSIVIYDGRIVMAVLETKDSAGSTFTASDTQLIFVRESLTDPNSFLVTAIPASATAIEYRYSRRYYLRNLPEDATQDIPFGSSGGTGSSVVIGTPTDGSYADGLLPLTASDTIADAFDDINEVLVYLAPSPPDALSGDLSLGIASYTGKLSQSSLSFISYSPGDSSSTITNIAEFTADIPNSTKFSQADLGSLIFNRNSSDVDSFNLATAFNEGERAGSQSYPPANSSNGYIRITAVGMYNGVPVYQKGAGTVRVGTSFGNSPMPGGEGQFQLRHVTTGTVSTNLLQVFYDPESNRPSVNGTPTISENTAQLKYLSGIRYYTTGSTFDATGGCLYLFEYTYVDNPVEIALTGLQTINMAITDGSVTGVSTPPVWNETLAFTNKLLTLDDADQTALNARMSVTPSDPIGNGSTVQSASEDRLIDTYGTSDSDDQNEYFTDEDYRQPSGAHDVVPTMTGVWTSTNVLTNGNAQVMLASLKYPTIDFSSYLPAQQASVDYSGFSGSQYYFRAFRENTVPHSSGTLRVTGITFADLGVNVDLEMKLPTQTGWLDLSTLFNVATFTGADGDGCLTSTSQDGSTLVLNWTAGTFSTADSGYLYVLRATLLTNTPTITQASETF